MLGIAETFVASLDLEHLAILRRNWMQLAFVQQSRNESNFDMASGCTGGGMDACLSTEDGRMLEHALCRVDFASDTVYVL